MAGFMDKLKQTFGKAKTKIDDAIDSEQVDKAKVKASGLATKASATAKETYEKVSDKARGDKHNDKADEATEGGAAATSPAATSPVGTSADSITDTVDPAAAATIPDPAAGAATPTDDKTP